LLFSIAVWPIGRRSILLCFLIAASVLQGISQSPTDSSPGKPVLKANVRAVKIDVLVTGKLGLPVQGLSERDFNVYEDGKSQRINYFMEHKEGPSADATALPPNTFVNVPRVSPAGVPTVILLDSLNTPIEAQAQVRNALLQSIDSIKPGNSVALFTLGFVLRRIQGFTDSPSVLKAALSNPVLRSNPRPSLLLDSKTEQTAEQQEAAAFGSVRTMQQMQSQSATTARTLMTLDAFRQLSGYLAGIEGRKDVIWISGAFPIYLGTNAGTQVDAGRYQQVNDKVKETDAELAGAEIAIYPIGAEGLQGNSLYDVDSQLAGVHNAQEAQTASNQALQADAIHRAANDAVMDEIAEETGGQAFYNRNGLGAALSRIMEQAGDYYTLYYQPTNQDFNGRFRKIKVQIPHTSDKLSFRRGYYATGSPQGDPDNLPAGTNPLLAAIVSGAPERTDIPLAVQVEAKPLPVDEAVEKNKQMPAKPVGAPVRYDLHFVAANKGLNLQQTADGKMADSLEVGIFAYSAQGKLNGWALHHLDISLTPAQYQETETNGFNFGLDFVAVGKPVVLRVGAYDKSNGRLGTLEVALDALVTAKGTDHK
jgi:VWFA-related protein